MDPTTRGRLGAVLEAVLGVAPEAIDPAARLDELAPLDSLSLAELASALDREFEIEVPGEELSTALSVAELEALIEQTRRNSAV